MTTTVDMKTEDVLEFFPPKYRKNFWKNRQIIWLPLGAHSALKLNVFKGISDITVWYVLIFTLFVAS